MKKFLVAFLKIALPLGLGIYLVLFFYNKLVEEGEWESFLLALKQANYSWVALSLVVALLSHVSRAWRWFYTLEPLGYKPQFKNSFFSVMIGYLMNLAVPRLGEITRCGVMSRYEKIPIEKLFGTVIAERVADLIILASITASVVFLQYEVIQGLIADVLNAGDSSSGSWLLYLLVIGGVLGAGAAVFFYRMKSENKLILLYQKIAKGILDGIASIYTMKKKWLFLGHTLFIWFAYFLMFYLCFFSLPETQNVPIGGVFTGFVMGGIAIALTNGGIGAYPLAVQLILGLYGVPEDAGGALGWIIWTAQTVLVMVVGGLSFFLIARTNPKASELSQTNQGEAVQA